VTNDELHLLMDVLKRVHANFLALEAPAESPYRRGANTYAARA
jgi:hypothetical protein